MISASTRFLVAKSSWLMLSWLITTEHIGARSDKDLKIVLHSSMPLSVSSSSLQSNKTRFSQNEEACSGF